MKDIFNHILILTALMILIGCSAEEEIDTPAFPKEIGLDVEFETRAGGTEETSSLEEYFIDGKSVILISQRGDTLSIDFNEKIISEKDPSGFTDNPNLYKYVYYSNPDANWDEGFNFQPFGNKALDWTFMEKNRLSGEYTLGALYYPVDYELGDFVLEDQSTHDALLRSNVLGAWHRTSALHDRLKFRFSHLMAAVKVTLLIPDWDPRDNSGFGPDAASEAYMLKMKKDFTISWPLAASSEEPPGVILTTDLETYDLKMYLESVSNTVETVNLKDINDSFPDLEESYRTATFTVLFPPQQATSDLSLMRFVLNTMGGTERIYTFNKTINDTNMSFGRNDLTHFILYIPRTETNAILIKSYIVPWTEAESEFSVIQDDM